MNKAFLIGRLTQDPTAQALSSGHSYCRFSIAVNRNYTSRDGENRADFINIVCWDGLAQNCVKYLKKGSQVAVTGSIQTGGYERDGIKRQTFDIRADQVEFLSRSTGDSAQSSAAQTNSYNQDVDTLKEVNDSDDDMPF